MSPTLAIGIVVVAIIGILVLRRVFRRRVVESIPHVTYVDETLLDLVRARQTSKLAKYYQDQTGVTAEEAEKVAYHLIGRPEAVMLLVRLQNEEHEPLYVDDVLLDYLKQGRVNKAALHYSDQTGAEPREALIAISAIAINPEMKFLPRKDKS